mgnify:CR=1 FL=1
MDLLPQYHAWTPQQSCLGALTEESLKNWMSHQIRFLICHQNPDPIPFMTQSRLHQKLRLTNECFILSFNHLSRQLPSWFWTTRGAIWQLFSKRKAIGRSVSTRCPQFESWTSLKADTNLTHCTVPSRLAPNAYCHTCYLNSCSISSGRKHW